MTHTQAHRRRHTRQIFRQYIVNLTLKQLPTNATVNDYNGKANVTTNETLR